MKVDDEEIALLQQIIMMRDRNQSFQSIAQALKISTRRVHAILRRNGVTPIDLIDKKLSGKLK